jgi:hypothetical protein
LGIIYLKFFGLRPGPFENRFHSFKEIAPDFLFIVEHIKNENSFLWASNNARDTLVNIVFVILSFNFYIRNSGIPLSYAFFIPCSYNFFA